MIKQLILIFLFLIVISLLAAPAVLAAEITELSFVGIGTVPTKVIHPDSYFWPLSDLINYFLTQGVQPGILYLILAIPFITFIIAFFRQIIGISTFGLYMPLLIALSF